MISHEAGEHLLALMAQPPLASMAGDDAAAGDDAPLYGGLGLPACAGERRR